jgi:hypothetical protein
MLGALDVDSAGVRHVLAELEVAPLWLSERLVAGLRFAS